MIQKRLLNRFKDKNPSPLNNLDFLLSHTYSQIIQVTNQVDNQRDQLARSAASLSNLIEILIKLTVLGASEKVTEEQQTLLRQILTPEIDDSNGAEMSWEDIMYINTAHLLRTCFAKKKQDTAGITSLEPITSTERLKKQFAAVLDRIKNGAQIEL